MGCDRCRGYWWGGSVPCLISDGRSERGRLSIKDATNLMKGLLYLNKLPFFAALRCAAMRCAVRQKEIAGSRAVVIHLCDG